MAENKFSKTDMERVALFQEMSYVTVGDKYKSQDGMAFNESASRGKQMLPGGSKTKNATQVGYFDEKFGRVLEGEAYSDQVKMRRQNRIKDAQKNIGRPFIPSSGEKKASGLGNYYGTLSGPMPALSPLTKPGKGYKAPGKNFYTNPGKKGTGYGYVPVTIGHYHEYKSDKYDQYREISRKEHESHVKSLKGGSFKLNMAPRQYFDENPFKSERPLPAARKADEKKWDVKPFKPSSPAKLPGGMMAGTFDVYPSHSADLYRTKRVRESSGVNKNKTFFPTQGPKSAPVNSILDQNVHRSMNVQNYRTIQSVMSY